MSFFDDCNPIDCALETVESLGLNIAKIGLFTRTWSGEKLGLGDPSDSLDLFTPTPRIRKISTKHNNKESGLEKRGDILIRMLSKTKYPEEDALNTVSDSDTKEIYYYVDGELYELVEVIENITHWDVLVKKAKKRKLFL